MPKPAVNLPAQDLPVAVRPGQQALDAGFRAFRQARYGEAIQAWEEANPESVPQLQPALAEAHFRRALSVTDVQAAIRDLRAALMAMPEDGRFWYHLGLALHRQRDLEGAREAYAQAARHTFGRSEPLAYVRGLLELEMAPSQDERGRAQAIPGLLPEEDLLAPIRALLRQDWAALASGALLSPRNAKGTPAVPGMAALLRGLGQIGLEQWALGVQTLGSLSQDLFPGPVEALRVVFLGRGLEQVGRAGEARKIRMAALARTRNPTLGAAVMEAALADLEAFLARGQWAQVAKDAQELLKLWPCARVQVAGAIALERLGREAAEGGRWAEAAKHWRELLRLGGKDLPGAAACAHNLALAYEGLEQWGQAATAWEAALAALPRRITKAQVKAGTGLDPEGLLRRRDWVERRALAMRERTGKVNAAVKQRQALIKRHPEDLALRLEQARTLLAQDKVRAAEREVQAILRLDPANPGALEAGAMISLLERQPKAAEAALRRALALEPGRISARIALAEALASQAERLPVPSRGEAIRMLEEAVGLSGKDAHLRLMLASLYLEGEATDEARLQIDAVLHLGRAGWREVFGFWAQRHDLDEAKALVRVGLANGLLDPDFYLEAGLACLQVVEELRGGAEEPFLGRLRMGKGLARMAARDKWSAFSRTLLQQAAPPDAPLDRLRQVVYALLEDHPELALPFAQRAAGMSPSDATVLMDLAVAQSGAGATQAASATLLRVERAARTHKNRVEAALVRDMLRLVADIGVVHLHDFFRRFMGMEDPDAFEPDDDGDPD